MNKKGYIQDIAFLGVFMLLFAIAIIIGGKIFSEYGEGYDRVNTTSSGIGHSIMQNYNDRYDSLYDYIFTTVLVFFVIGLFISFFLIDTHPAFFFVILILLIFIVVANAILGNVYEKFTDGDLAADAEGFSIMNYLFDNWVLLIVVIGFVSLGVLFAKMRTGVFR